MLFLASIVCVLTFFLVVGYINSVKKTPKDKKKKNEGERTAVELAAKGAGLKRMILCFIICIVDACSDNII